MDTSSCPAGWGLGSPLLIAIALGASLGCNGAIGPAGSDRPGVAGGGTGLAPGGVGSAPSAMAPPLAGNTFIDPGSRSLLRLTNVEYSQTVSDLLGEPADAASRFDFPEDARGHGFDNNVDLLHVSTAHAQQYATAAAAIALATFATPERRALVLSCDATSGAPCLTAYVRTLGRRMFRRPLTDAEVSAYVSLCMKAASATDPNAGPSVALEAMLQSPNFLYRTQVGTPDAKNPGVVGLTGFELAARLSYFLFGTSPDDALLDQVQAGALDDAAGAKKLVIQMLADPRARRGVQRFYSQWLPLTEISGATADLERVPNGDLALGAEMVQETTRFVDDVLWDSGGTVTDLLTARYTFVDAAVATIYGVDAPPQGWQRIDFPASSPRAGLLTQPSLLAAGSHGVARPSSTRRGEMVREQLLCVDIPSPPPGVAGSPPVPKAGETEQQTFAQHTTDVSCATCHTLMDPIGWGLSGFDGGGKIRTKDSNGQAISVAGQITGFSMPAFTGPVELGQKIAASDDFKGCFARQLFRYTFARVEQPADANGIAELRAGFEASQWDLPKALATLVESNAFRYHAKGDAP